MEAAFWDTLGFSSDSFWYGLIKSIRLGTLFLAQPFMKGPKTQPFIEEKRKRKKKLFLLIQIEFLILYIYIYNYVFFYKKNWMKL